jgi:hypothetical protein
VIPCVVIEVEFERPAPRVRVVCMNSSEEDRLSDWLKSQGELLDLVCRAIELEQEARAA